MQHLLLPYDGSDSARNALAYVVDQHHRYDMPMKVTLINVIDVPYVHGDAVTVSMTDSIALNLVEHGQRLLNEPKQVLEQAQIEVSTCVESGAAAKMIADKASDAGCDAIVMGTRGLGKLGELVLGSVAYKTAHLATVPVTLVK